MRKLLLISVPVLLLASCAQVISPGGGPKDITPPVVVRYLPDSAATNFTGKKIDIRFNEYVRLTDLNNQLIISPPLKNMPDVEVKKKDVVITFDDTLLPNTTYTISFGKAIADITEGNVLDNFRYVFSTGPYIDSLEIKGKVINASTLDGEKGIYVMLYQQTDDSVPMKQRPYYFTKTKEDGSFLFTNLRSGKYKVFALDDKNSNYLFDNSEERVAFADAPIDLHANIDSLKLKLFHEEPSSQKRLRAAQVCPGRVTFMYAFPVADPVITFLPALNSGMVPYAEKSRNGDSLDVWFSNVTSDSLIFRITDGKTLVDSVMLPLTRPGVKSSHVRAGSVDARKLQLSANIAAGQRLDYAKPLTVTTNNPIVKWDTSGIILVRGKDTLSTALKFSGDSVPKQVSAGPIHPGGSMRTFVFTNTMEEDSTYLLFIKPGAMTDCFGQKNDTLKMVFRVQSQDAYGNLHVKLTDLPAEHYIIQVLSDKGEVVRQSKVTGDDLHFDLLSPGNYRLKLIDDENNNGKWDPGNYLLHRQPERVIFYKNSVRLRAGWDMDVEWIFK
ncbi:MAG TPA: Ig-like domain-containing protein [Bacteroidia bacterium]|nr:Ig-like domain-containing protein [Bacteroidia bacterium]